MKEFLPGKKDELEDTPELKLNFVEKEKIPKGNYDYPSETLEEKDFNIRESHIIRHDTPNIFGQSDISEAVETKLSLKNWVPLSSSKYHQILNFQDHGIESPNAEENIEWVDD